MIAGVFADYDINGPDVTPRTAIKVLDIFMASLGWIFTTSFGWMVLADCDIYGPDVPPYSNKSIKHIYDVVRVNMYLRYINKMNYIVLTV